MAPAGGSNDPCVTLSISLNLDTPCRHPLWHQHDWTLACRSRKLRDMAVDTSKSPGEALPAGTNESVATRLTLSGFPKSRKILRTSKTRGFKYDHNKPDSEGPFSSPRINETDDKASSKSPMDSIPGKTD